MQKFDFLYFTLLYVLIVLSLFRFDYIIFVVVLGFIISSLGFGLNNTVKFLLLTAFVSFLFEFSGVHFGIPFGKYFYTNILGYKLLGVPISVIFMWFGFESLVYLYLFNRPFLGALVPTLMDLIMDPFMSNKAWIWQTKFLNFYQGIPLSNFLGWYILSFLLFIIANKIGISKRTSLKLNYRYISFISYFYIDVFWIIENLISGNIITFVVGIFVIIVTFIIFYTKETKQIFRKVIIKKTRDGQ